MHKKTETELLLEEVESLQQKVADSDGFIQDSDTVLADLMDEVDFEVSGSAEQFFDIWRNSTDKKSIEDVFEFFTDTTFLEYLKNCKKTLSKYDILKKRE